MLRANATHGITLANRPQGWSIEKLLRQWQITDRVEEASKQVKRIKNLKKVQIIKII